MGIAGIEQCPRLSGRTRLGLNQMAPTPGGKERHQARRVRLIQGMAEIGARATTSRAFRLDHPIVRSVQVSRKED